MNITITEMAATELEKIFVSDDMALRIDAELSGCCTWTLTVKIIPDELRRNDTVILKENMRFYIDHFTKKYIGEEIVLDFDSSTGYTLSNTDNIFICTT